MSYLTHRKFWNFIFMRSAFGSALFIRNSRSNFKFCPSYFSYTMCENLSTTQKLKRIKEKIKCHPNFPKKGVMFRDIFPVLADPPLFKELQEIMLLHAKSIQPPVEYIGAVDSRGFLFGSLLAYDLNIGFVPIRKKGKLPGEVQTIDYDLEYGKNSLEVQKGIIKNCARVMVVDDLLATGGTLQAAASLVESVGGKVVECLVVIELLELNGRSKVKFPVHSLIEF